MERSHDRPWCGTTRPCTSFGFSGDQKLHHVKNTIWDGTYRGQQNYNPKSSFSSKAKSPKLHKPLQRMESSVSVVELERDRRKRWSVNAGYKTLLTCGEDDTRTPAHERNAKEWSRGFRYYKRNAGGKSLNLWNDVYHTPATGVWRTLPRNIQNIEEKERADKAYASMLRKIHQEDLLHKRKKTLQKFYDAKLQRVILEEKAGMLPEQYKGYVEKPTYSGGDRNIISPHDGTPILKKTLKFYGQTSKKNLWDNVERLEDRQLRWKISADADLAAMKAIEKKVVRAHQLELLQNDARRQSINKTREKFRASREENLKAQLSISSPKTLRLLREGLPRPMKHSSSADYLATTKQRFEHPPHIPLSHTDYKDLYVVQDEEHGIGRRKHMRTLTYAEKRDRMALELSRTGNLIGSRRPSGSSIRSTTAPLRFSRGGRAAKRANALSEIEAFEKSGSPCPDNNVYCTDYLDVSRDQFSRPE